MSGVNPELSFWGINIYVFKIVKEGQLCLIFLI